MTVQVGSWHEAPLGEQMGKRCCVELHVCSARLPACRAEALGIYQLAVKVHPLGKWWAQQQVRHHPGQARSKEGSSSHSASAHGALHCASSASQPANPYLEVCGGAGQWLHIHAPLSRVQVEQLQGTLLRVQTFKYGLVHALVCSSVRQRVWVMSVSACACVFACRHLDMKTCTLPVQ